MFAFSMTVDSENRSV